jgi:alpha-beta hydrolase superfamily lysophospholipase
MTSARPISPFAAPALVRALCSLALLGLVGLLVSTLLGSVAWAQVSEERLVRLITPDEVPLDGLYRPGSTRPEIGVLVIHGFGGTFRSPMEATLAETLAARGYATLTLDVRDHGCCIYRGLFEDSTTDLAAGIELLAQEGAASVVVVGHSLGANRAAYYQAHVADPIVRGVVLAAPAGNLHDRAFALGGERAETVYQEALRRVEQGDRPGSPLLVPLGSMGAFSFTSPSLVSYGAPDTNADHLKWLPYVEVPVLAVHGTRDALAPIEQSALVAEAATMSPRTDVAYIPGADHEFTFHDGELTDLIDAWIGSVLS